MYLLTPQIECHKASEIRNKSQADGAIACPGEIAVYLSDKIEPCAVTSISVTSSGPAAKKFPLVMGEYELDPTLTAEDRPVYKKTDRDYFIYYSGELYFILVITVTQLYLSLQLLDPG